MELPSKLLEQIAFNTRPKLEEHMLIVMDKSTQEEHLSQSLQFKKKHFKKALTFLPVSNGIFNVTNKNNKFYFKKQLPTERILLKQASVPEPTKSKNWKKKLNEILLMKNITPKQNNHSQSNQIFQTLDLS